MKEDHSFYTSRSDSAPQRDDNIIANDNFSSNQSPYFNNGTTNRSARKKKKPVSLKIVVIFFVILIVLFSVVSFVIGKKIAKKQISEFLTGYSDYVNMSPEYNEEDIKFKEELEKAMNFGSEGNYPMAIATLNGIIDNYPEAQTSLAEYSLKYENQIVEAANDMKNNDNLNEAVALVSDALKVLPDSTVLASKYQELKKCLPQKMLAVAPSYQSGGNRYKEYSYSNTGGTEYFSMGGVKYTDGMTFNADINIFDEVSWAVYNLNSEYNTLEFTVGHVDGTFNGNNTSLQIFCDGELTQEIPLAPEMIPITVSLDVNGVAQLKMQVHASGADNPEYGIGNPMIK